MAEKFESIEFLRNNLEHGHEYEIAYKGNKYSLYSLIYASELNIPQQFSIDRIWIDGDTNNYDTFDELMGCFKIDGKSLREVILDVDILYHS